MRSTALALILAVCVAALIAMIQAVRARQPFAQWWRPVAAVLLAPLGLLGYLGYVAWRRTGLTDGSGSRSTPAT